MTGRTLVIAPHPDDEILGCGGTLLRRKAEGGALGWLIVTGMDEQSGWSTERIRQREEEISQVASMTGFDQVFKLGLPAAGLETLPLRELVAAFSSVFESFEPEEVLVPHRGDVHSDHRVTFDAVAACTKWFRYPSVHRVLAYETISETEFGLSSETIFNPNVFVDIGEYLDRKLEILSVYKTELGEFPFPRSIRAVRALAEWRGAGAGYQA
ncbi:MAG: PIG-L family deacetylase, partial [Cyanobacteria bacterium]|nr:PIG-L family deacetylase [Cyanobacteriota bacterium]